MALRIRKRMRRGRRDAFSTAAPEPLSHWERAARIPVLKANRGDSIKLRPFNPEPQQRL